MLASVYVAVVVPPSPTRGLRENWKARCCMDFGVQCKNSKCQFAIMLGDSVSRPKTDDEAISFISIKAGRLTCPACGQTHDYSQSDLRVFGPPGM